jgi:hypothetical protein
MCGILYRYSVLMFIECTFRCRDRINMGLDILNRSYTGSYTGIQNVFFTILMVATRNNCVEVFPNQALRLASHEILLRPGCILWHGAFR